MKRWMAMLCALMLWCASAGALEEGVEGVESRSPFRMDLDMFQPTRQMGVPVALTAYSAEYGYRVEYPETGTQADALLKQWANEQVEDFTRHYTGRDAAAGTATGELNISYSAWRAGGRYAGILQYGWRNGALDAHPADILYALNVDVATGQTYKGRTLFRQDGMAGVLAMLARQRLPYETGDAVPEESWLDNAVLTDSGIIIALAQGSVFPAYAGTLLVSIPYSEVKGMLAIDIDAPPAGTAAPQGTQAEATAPPEAVPDGPRVIDPSRPMIALTFDDGPSEFTRDIVRTLEENGGRATFFCIGSHLMEQKDTVLSLIQNGHQIACHTWSHPNLKKLGEGKIAWQIDHAQQELNKIADYHMTMLRPPFGEYDRKVSAVTRKRKMPIILWSVDTRDWAARSTRETVKAILKGASNGGIVLCHDLYESTAKAIRQAVPELVKRGYQLVTLEEMMSFRNKPLKPGTAYSHLDPKKILVP